MASNNNNDIIIDNDLAYDIKDMEHMLDVITKRADIEDNLAEKERENKLYYELKYQELYDKASKAINDLSYALTYVTTKSRYHCGSSGNVDVMKCNTNSLYTYLKCNAHPCFATHKERPLDSNIIKSSIIKDIANLYVDNKPFIDYFDLPKLNKDTTCSSLTIDEIKEEPNINLNDDSMLTILSLKAEINKLKAENKKLIEDHQASLDFLIKKHKDELNNLISSHTKEVHDIYQREEVLIQSLEEEKQQFYNKYNNKLQSFKDLYVYNMRLLKDSYTDKCVKYFEMYNTSKQTLEDKEAEINNLNDIIKDLDKRLGHLLMEIDSLKQDKQSLEEQLNASNETIVAYNDLKERHSKLQHAFNKLVE
jgi:hypothetical protein